MRDKKPERHRGLTRQEHALNCVCVCVCCLSVCECMYVCMVSVCVFVTCVSVYM
jgi:hypothetical protein